jgi:hypothetical protein
MNNNDPKNHLQVALNHLGAIKSRVKPELIAKTAGPLRESTEHEYKGVRIVDDAKAGKCRLFFKSIPSPKVRTFLKKHGFYWSATDRCWHADRTGQTDYIVEKAIDKMSGV